MEFSYLHYLLYVLFEKIGKLKTRFHKHINPQIKVNFFC